MRRRWSRRLKSSRATMTRYQSRRDWRRLTPAWHGPIRDYAHSKPLCLRCSLHSCSGCRSPFLHDEHDAFCGYVESKQSHYKEGHVADSGPKLRERTINFYEIVKWINVTGSSQMSG